MISSPLPSFSPRVLLTLLALSSLWLVGCGAPDYCADPSFQTFYQDEWTAYCAALEDRLARPLNYELVPLTSFFSGYAEKSAEYRGRLGRYPEPRRCVAGSSDEVEHIALERCLNHDASMDTRIHQAIDARMEPWIEEMQAKVKRLRVDLESTSNVASRLEGKLQMQIDQGAPMDVDQIQLFSTLVRKNERDAQAIGTEVQSFENLQIASMSNDAVNAYISSTHAPALSQIESAQAKNQKTLDRVSQTERYLTLAAPGIARACISSRGKRKEKRIAKQLLKDKMAEVSAPNTLHIEGKGIASTTAKDRTQHQSFIGAFCGKRGATNQFADRRALCAEYTFEIARLKRDGEPWTEWEIGNVTEGGAERSVACDLL